MSFTSRLLGSRSVVQFATVGVIAALVSGCSSDSTRVGSIGGQQRSATADLAPMGSSAPTTYASAAPTSAIQSTPLAAPVQSRPLSTPTAVNAPIKATRPQLSSALTPAPVAAPIAAASKVAAGGWTPEGGTPIVVAQGESLAMLSSRYGVPPDALMRVNGFSSASQVQPGARLIVPVAPGSNLAAARTSAPQLAKNAAAERLALAKTDAKADAKKLATPVVAPVVAAAKTAAPVVAAAAPAKVQQVAAVAAKEAPHAKQPVDMDATASLPAEASAVSDAANPEFRWPARGRIIQSFKPGSNDGINIAVPEGTSIKAAESGVVLYSGSELKGLGNLVLIRHPNGFVSAYANNGELKVKRGEVVKRGDVVAKSGQSGNVASPQLHFELRKGSTPVDPTNFLAGL